MQGLLNSDQINSSGSGLYAWGNNTSEQLCLPTAQCGTCILEPTFLHLDFPIQSIAAGEGHVLFLTTDGKLFTSGTDSSSSATSSSTKSTPRPLPLPRTARIVAVSCGLNHSAAISGIVCFHFSPLHSTHFLHRRGNCLHMGTEQKRRLGPW